MAGLAAASEAGPASEAALRIEASFLQHWQLADTAKALQPGMPAGVAQLLRGWLLRQRRTTLDPLLADPASMQALGQAAVSDRNVPLLELLLELPGFSAQGELVGREGQGGAGQGSVNARGTACGAVELPTVGVDSPRHRKVDGAVLTRGLGRRGAPWAMLPRRCAHRRRHRLIAPPACRSPVPLVSLSCRPVPAPPGQSAGRDAAGAG